MRNSQSGENATTIEELNYLKSMIEVSYRPRMIRIIIWCEVLFILCFISIATSAFLFAVTMVSPQLHLMVPTVCFAGSLIIFIWMRKNKDKASRILSLIERIEGLDDPTELDSIDLDDYGLEWVVDK